MWIHRCGQLLMISILMMGGCSGEDSGDGPGLDDRDTSPTDTGGQGDTNDPVDTTRDTGTDVEEDRVDTVEDTPPPIGGPRAMLTLHVDPNGPTRGIINATPEHWMRWKNFVAAADAHGHKLTMLMSSDWVEVVESEPGGVEQMKTWIDNGHQLGYHHHTCGHANPDGYRDGVIEGRCGREADRGSVQDSFGQVVALSQRAIELGADPESARVEVAAQGPNDDNLYRANEWQPEAIYATGNVADNSDGHTDHRFITQPRCTEDYGNRYSGSAVTYRVPELGHSQLDIGNFTQIQSENNLATLEAEIDEVLNGGHEGAGVYIGVVFHPREYAENERSTSRDSYTTDKAYLDAVLQLFTDKGIPVVTARDILGSDNPCDR